tara:strand:- start:35 stop:937 length:903 start_codon:yes stop_codon:yes gene_type:complete
MYDLIIIGAGPAGITASVYAVRKGLDFLVISEDIGGQTALSGDVANYTGYQFISGPELAAKFEEHISQYNISLKEGETVTQTKKTADCIEVTTNKGSYSAKSLIIASGKRSRQLNVPGEKEFKNRGLTYCATCDGPLFKAKDVVVIGGGNSGLDATMGLLKIVNKIYIVNNAPQLTGDKILIEKVEANSKVTILNSTQVLEIKGETFLNEIKIKTEAKEQTLAVEGIFVEIGLIPNCEFALGIDKNQINEIKIDPENRTNLEGVFAAGDVTDVIEKQIIIAAGEGAKAALSAFKYLSRVL